VFRRSHQPNFNRVEPLCLCYESEALGHAELNRLLTVWLDEQIPQPLARVQEREDAELEELRDLLEAGSG
jgi:hypothetical protein